MTSWSSWLITGLRVTAVSKKKKKKNKKVNWSELTIPLSSKECQVCEQAFFSPYFRLILNDGLWLGRNQKPPRIRWRKFQKVREALLWQRIWLNRLRICALFVERVMSSINKMVWVYPGYISGREAPSFGVLAFISPNPNPVIKVLVLWMRLFCTSSFFSGSS